MAVWQTTYLATFPTEPRTPTAPAGLQPLAELSAPNIAANGSRESAFYGHNYAPDRST